MSSDPIIDLLERGAVAVNLGLREFADTLDAQGAEVVHVEWRPPQELEPDLEALLAQLS